MTVLWCCMVCLWCDEFEFSDCYGAVWCVYGVMTLSLVTVLWCCTVCLWCDEFEFSDCVMVLYSVPMV